jgi:hypothetical protein
MLTSKQIQESERMDIEYGAHNCRSSNQRSGVSKVNKSEQLSNKLDSYLSTCGFDRMGERLWILHADSEPIIRVSLSFERGTTYNEKDGSQEYREWVVTVYERGDLFLTKSVLYSQYNVFVPKFEEYMKRVITYVS